MLKFPNTLLPGAETVRKRRRPTLTALMIGCLFASGCSATPTTNTLTTKPPVTAANPSEKSVAANEVAKVAQELGRKIIDRFRAEQENPSSQVSRTPDVDTFANTSTVRLYATVADNKSTAEMSATGTLNKADNYPDPTKISEVVLNLKDETGETTQFVSMSGTPYGWNARWIHDSKDPVGPNGSGRVPLTRERLEGLKNTAQLILRIAN